MKFSRQNEEGVVFLKTLPMFMFETLLFEGIQQEKDVRKLSGSDEKIKELN